MFPGECFNFAVQVNTRNTISVTFPDGGGYVSSVALQAYEFSREVKRFEDPTTGIQSIFESNIQILPNPASNQIHILSGSNEMAQHIEIFSLAGEIILHKDLTSQNQSIGTEHLTNGIYLVKIRTHNNYFSHKIVVKK